MFENARLRLTTWYLIIIMVVSFFFSVSFYNVATQEIGRLSRLQELRSQTSERFFPSPRAIVFYPGAVKDLEESAQRLKILLILINGGIFIIAGTAAYFLASRTLKPISKMVDQQKRFISDASHELRTPITSLRSEIEVAMRNKNLTLPEAKTLLKSNLEETISLQKLTDNLLSFSKFDITQNIQSFEELSIKDTLADALKKINGNIKKKNITIEQKIQNIKIDGIEDRIVELFVIILDNSVKYSDKNGKVQIMAKRTEGKARIEIKDDGSGISKEDLPHIWDRFYRTSKSRTKHTVTGHGLGLSIAKEIVQLHSGNIFAKSTPNKGTTIVIEL